MSREHFILFCVAALLVGLLFVCIEGCAPVEKPSVASIVPSVSAEEFDPAPVPARKYRNALTRNARVVWGMTAPIPVFAGQIAQESGWNENAKSYVGAQGLAQFMPSTADWIDDAYPDLGPAQPYNPDWAIRALVRYDRHLWQRLDYNLLCSRIGATLSAYNGGIGWHDKRRAKADDRDDFWGSVRLVNPGITPANQQQNADYPKKIVYDRQRQYLTWGETLCI